MSEAPAPSKPTLVTVAVFDIGADEPCSERTIDYNRRSDREWLTKHQYWALCNHKIVEISRADP